MFITKSAIEKMAQELTDKIERSVSLTYSDQGGPDSLKMVIYDYLELLANYGILRGSR